jgi:hypothetical protein
VFWDWSGPPGLTPLVRFLLTSAGLRNQSLRQALYDLLEKPSRSANMVSAGFEMTGTGQRITRARGRRLVNSVGCRVLPGRQAGQDGVVNALVDHRGAEADDLAALA